MKLHHLLEASARRHPEHVGVVDPERGVLATYQALEALAEATRAQLQESGVHPGDRVGLCLPKSIEAVAAIFGILKAGAAYVPVDATAPAPRNAGIFQDCTVRAVITSRPLVEELRVAYEGALPEGKPLATLNVSGLQPVLLVFPDMAQAPEAERGGGADERAYILYTSGSTGRPKGVVHTHRSALSFVNWCSETFQPTDADCFSSHAPFHFDLSILDLYVPLKYGARLVLLGEDLGKQPQRLAPVIAEQGISVWYSTPSILRLLVDYGHLERYAFPVLRLVLFAGEVFPIKHFRTLHACWPEPTYYNLYGPTETNVCTFYRVPPEEAKTRVDPFPIGRTCANDATRVVDAEGHDVPRGEEGELWVSGGTVMQGYWNRPDRTAAAFFVGADGTRWYRTGDVVQEDGDGQYLFVGRRDRMIKRRGYRVELGEIEAALYRHPSVVEAAVVALPDEESGVLLKAFLCWYGDGVPSLIQLKQFCAAHLPLYMIPDRFSMQPALPKTSTDKIDYQRLKTLD